MRLVTCDMAWSHSEPEGCKICLSASPDIQIRITSFKAQSQDHATRTDLEGDLDPVHTERRVAGATQLPGITERVELVEESRQHSVPGTLNLADHRGGRGDMQAFNKLLPRVHSSTLHSQEYAILLHTATNT